VKPVLSEVEGNLYHANNETAKTPRTQRQFLQTIGIEIVMKMMTGSF
jgi:hypothetical protein